MFKKIIIFLFTAVILFVLFSYGISQNHTNEESSVSGGASSGSSENAQTAENNSTDNYYETPETVYKNPLNGELNAVWFSYYEISDMIKGKSEAEFRRAADEAFQNAASFGLNAVIVHVRPSSDAFYESDIFPWSIYCTGTQGVSPGYDPLRIMVESAHSKGLKLHAWINPLRVCSVKNFDKLSAGNPAKIWLEDSISENDSWVRTSGGYYYNPTVPEVRQLIIDGCKEVVSKYDVDGIQFDDYFYPTTDASFDEKEYEEYKAENSQDPMSLYLWRKEQINRLVKGVYQAVKAIKPEVIFGISPTSNIEENTDEFYADVPLWLSVPGYVDYLCPQIYFGFEHPTEEVRYQNRLARWTSLEKSDDVRLLIGLASYRAGEVIDDYTEWRDNTDIQKRQVEAARAYKSVNGFMFYSYTYLFGSSESQKAERNNLSELF